VAGDEPLPSMAYFCLTVLEYQAKNREAAAKQYAIDLKVLKKLGGLTAKGDPMTARKVTGTTGSTHATATRMDRGRCEGDYQARGRGLGWRFAQRRLL